MRTTIFLLVSAGAGKKSVLIPADMKIYSDTTKGVKRYIMQITTAIGQQYVLQHKRGQ